MSDKVREVARVKMINEAADEFAKAEHEDIDGDRREALISSTVGMLEPIWCKYMTKAIEMGFIEYYTDNIDEKGETDIVTLVQPIPDYNPECNRLPIRFCPFCGKKITMFVAPGDECKDISAERKAMDDEYWDEALKDDDRGYEEPERDYEMEHMLDKG